MAGLLTPPSSLWLSLLLLFVRMVEPASEQCSCSIQSATGDEWSCKVIEFSQCSGFVPPSDAVQKQNFLQVMNLDPDHGINRTGTEYYFPKPALNWTVRESDLLSIDYFGVEYFKVIEAKSGNPESKSCYKVYPSNKGPVGNQVESMATVTMDCFQPLSAPSGSSDKDRTRDAALLRVFTSNRKNQTQTQTQPIFGEVIIDSMRTGLPRAPKDYTGEMVLMIQAISCPIPRVVVHVYRPMPNHMTSGSAVQVQLHPGDPDQTIKGIQEILSIYPPDPAEFKKRLIPDRYYVEALDLEMKNHGTIFSKPFRIRDNSSCLGTFITGGDTEESSFTQIVAILLGVFGGVLLALIGLAGYLVKRQSKNDGNRVLIPPHNNRQEGATPAELHLTPPSVYLMYHADDKYHKNVVYYLTLVLKQCFGCDVRSDTSHRDHEQIMHLNKPSYVEQQWMDVNCVLVINSRGAFESANKDSYPSREVRCLEYPTAGTFKPSLERLKNWVYSEKKHRRKDLVVRFAHFGYTDKTYHLYSDYPQFKLPADIHKLVEDIYSGVLQSNAFKNSKEFQDLLGSIASAENFYNNGAEDYHSYEDPDQLDSGIGPSMDDERRPAIWRQTEEQHPVPVYVPPRNDDVTSLDSNGDFHSNAPENSMMDPHSLLPSGGDNSYYRHDSYISSSEDVRDFHPPPVDRSSSHGSLDAAVSEPLLALSSHDRGQHRPEVLEYMKTQPAVSPQHSFPPSGRNSGHPLGFGGYSSEIPSHNQTFPDSAAGSPYYAGGMPSHLHPAGSLCAQAPSSSFIGPEESDADTDIGGGIVPPSETDACSSLHSSMQELEMGRINMEGDWSS